MSYCPILSLLSLPLHSLQLGVTPETPQDKLVQSNEQLRVDGEKWKEDKDNQLKPNHIP